MKLLRRAAMVLAVAALGACRSPKPHPRETEPKWDGRGVLRGLAVDGELDPLDAELEIEHLGRTIRQSDAVKTASTALPAAWTNAGLAASDPTSALRTGNLGPFALWEEQRSLGPGLPGVRIVYTLRAHGAVSPAPIVRYRLRVPVAAEGASVALDEHVEELRRASAVRTEAASVHRIAFTTARATWEIIPSEPIERVKVRRDAAKDAPLELELVLSEMPFEPEEAWSVALRFRRAQEVRSDLDPAARQLLDLAHARTSSRAAAAHRDTIRSLEAHDPRAELEARRAALLRVLGLGTLPPRPPLAPVVKPLHTGDGYLVEALTFSSRPDLRVTAALYRPTGSETGRRPALICPSGHYAEGKAQPNTQRLAVRLAKLGFVVLAMDTVGTGERSGEDQAHEWGLLSTLSGETFAGLAVWDVLRAVDYLESRADVDAARIGVTGVSGGGLLSLLAAAIDPRIRAAAPAAWPSALEHAFAAEVSYCPCNYLPNLAESMDEGDILGLAAPRAMLILAGEQDLVVPVRGAWRAYLDARTIYRRVNAEAAVHVATFPGGHELTPAMRTAITEFFTETLANGAPRPVPPETTEPLLSEAELLAHPEKSPKKEETVRSLLRAEARSLGARRDDRSTEDRRDALRRVAGWARAEAMVGTLQPVRAQGGGPGTIEELGTRDGHAVVAARLGPKKADGPLAILLGEERADARLRSPLAETLRDREMEVVSVELRGTGRSAPPANARIFLSGVVLAAGSNMATLRAAELVAYLRTVDRARPVLVVSTSAATSLAALIALAIEPRPSAQATLEGLPARFAELFEEDPSADGFELSIPDLLEVADVPDLVALTGVHVVLGADGTLTRTTTSGEP